VGVRPVYTHVATEIKPRNGVPYIIEAVPPEVRAIALSRFLAEEAARGASVTQYSPVKTPTSTDLKKMDIFARAQEHEPYDWNAYAGYTDTTGKKWVCSELSNAISQIGGLGSIGNRTVVPNPSPVLAILNPYLTFPVTPSDIASSSNYRAVRTGVDMISPGTFAMDDSAGSFANGGFVIYPNKANTNMMRSVYAK